ncbi:hypothetical protein COCC4DRAFT_45406 [Bipolaris maydis ATCC 48331]|uniref:Caspase family p20 domain-containing protein n=3 Tax=Cochliobolus heterostrophus TaxID=5016 RepID=M2V127_COCH5|nr:uncharacterized protein COCC4DRAFT_45406 [Bipolaris maydis ATCC 48331]EMD93728.1 hypothetical protein COCHEDRAFT_1212410 [Bipolaris maydis C5]KAH7562622.1 hypothetical protein BM1_02142 [Bipolaris maydis]ENH99302.1 hypothetical protein COCC4DRAFT_45406 [Bipolaris maydis ATCC 48331]KAJ5028012.1 hypothetical protein J3E73DRAFT_255928 [Bipolaris maydis]KAJ5062786.1 hypothetical protein J3E74DRAFT_288469 [Bipolaris maydis]
MSGPQPPRASQTVSHMSKAQISTELSAAIQSGTGKNARQDYKTMTAVLIHFKNDDIGCEDLEKQLAEVFKNFYGFHNIIRLLLKDYENPIGVIWGVLSDLVAKGFAKKNCLVVVVFAGHGKALPVYTSSSVRGPEYVLKLGGALRHDGRFKTRELDWKMATSLLGTEQCDVLHILDCCYAAEGMNLDAELLAAATETASADAKTCFTAALCHQLHLMSSQQFTVSTLYQSLMTDRRALKLKYIPFHSYRDGKPSIILGGSRGKAAVVPPLKPDSPRILLTAHLEGPLDKGSVEGLKKWLNEQLPYSIMNMEIKLEGVWDASSTVLLFSIPITVWTQLNRNNTAFNYVGEVTSYNKLLEQGTTTLSVRPPQGSENLKPGESSGQK